MLRCDSTTIKADDYKTALRPKEENEKTACRIVDGGEVLIVRLHTLSLNAVAVLTINQISHICVLLVVHTLKFLKSFESYWDLIKFPLASVASCA